MMSLTQIYISITENEGHFAPVNACSHICPVCKRNDRAKFDTSMKISHLMEFEA